VEGLQAARGCGLVPSLRGKGSVPVYQEEGGTFRHEATECPVSVMGREGEALLLFNHWQILGAPPISYDDVDDVLWEKLSALRAEAQWYKYAPRPKDKDAADK